MVRRGIFCDLRRARRRRKDGGVCQNFPSKAVSMLITRGNYVPSYVLALLFHAENYKLVFSSLAAAVCGKQT